jgi:hypothetical protein
VGATLPKRDAENAHKRVDDTLVDRFAFLVAEHQREPFDVFHAYFLTQAGFVATYAEKYLNVPSVVSIRGNDVERAAFDPSKLSHGMYMLQNASAVTTNASELAMYCSKRWRAEKPSSRPRRRGIRGDKGWGKRIPRPCE